MSSATKALFVVLDGLLPLSSHLLPQRLAGLLADFRAHGFKVIGVRSSRAAADPRLADALDEVVEVDGDFAPTAWSLARRYSLNMARSILVSADHAHAGWARNAGVRRFETPGMLFGI